MQSNVLYHPSDPSSSQRPLRVNLAKPPKPGAGFGTPDEKGYVNKAVWEDERWLKKYNRPVGAGAGGEEEKREEEGMDED
jgi:hypothetical protein